MRALGSINYGQLPVNERTAIQEALQPLGVEVQELPFCVLRFSLPGGTGGRLETDRVESALATKGFTIIGAQALDDGSVSGALGRATLRFDVA